MLILIRIVQLRPLFLFPSKGYNKKIVWGFSICHYRLLYMFETIVGFLKKHTTIKNKAILLVYLVVIFYKFAFSLFQFSILRFLKGSIGDEFLLIGALLAVSNFIAIFLDIPLGLLQKYIRPRVFMIIAVLFLLISDLIFVFSAVNLWLAFVAVFLFQISIEIYFITITTYILRLSRKEDYAQNIAQEDIADNIGDILGLGLGGILFVVDRFLGASNLFAAGVLGFLIILLLVFIYEFLDHKQHSALEDYILNLKYSKTVIDTASHIGTALVEEKGASPEEVNKTQEERKTRFSWSEMIRQFRETFGNLYDIFTFKIKAPLLLWSFAILIVTYFWYESINYFEPVFVKEIFSVGKGFIIENVPRYFFESLMFIMALVIPTFLLELPLGKLADKYGKDKMVVLGTLTTGISLLFLGFVETGALLFVIFLTISCGFSVIYPSIVGLIGQEYQKTIASQKQLALPEGQKMDNQEDTMAEGDSAGLISIIVNGGQILAGLVGGALFQYASLSLIFLGYGVFLILMSIGSGWFLWKIGKKTV